MAKTPKANDTFHRLVNGKGAKAKLNRCMLIKDMLIEMKRHGIRYPASLQYYSVEEHVPLIQKYLNEKFPAEYRLSVFGENGQTKPIWKGSDRAQKDICIYINEGHYFGIRKLNSLFGKNIYYCLDCETTYQKKNEHRQVCAAKCPRCCGMGPDFPCKEIENFELKCLKCNNLLRNPTCYKRHIDKGICEIFKRFINILIKNQIKNRCKECGQIYRVQNKADKEGHVWFVRFCSLCHSKHRRDEQCFVQPIVPKQTQSYLMVILIILLSIKIFQVVYDFECQLISPSKNTNDSSSQDENYQLHHVNCVSVILNYSPLKI